MTTHPLEGIVPGMLVEYEKPNDTIIPQIWIFPPGARSRKAGHPRTENLPHIEATGVLQPGFYVVIAVVGSSVHLIVDGKVCEVLCPIDLYRAETGNIE